MTDSYPTTLTIHAGFGKTGSSSIQKTLHENKLELLAQNVRYLGYMLEDCAATERVKKPPLGLDLFGDKDPAEFSDLLHDVLSQEVEDAGSKGVTRLIWSNESILARPRHLIPALVRLRDRGVPVEVQCYLRRHDSWAQSAYFQWAVKHKTQPGPVLSFHDWAAKWNIGYEPKVRPWIAAFGDDFKLFNYDAHPDVVQHFLQVNGISLGNIARENEARTPEELLVWSAFNSSFEQPVLPDRLEPLLQELKVMGEQLPCLPEPAALFPSVQDLEDVLRRCGKDIQNIDLLFSSRGEPTFDLSSPVRAMRPVDPKTLSDLLFRLFLLAYQEASGSVEASRRVIPQVTTPGGSRPSPDDLAQFEAREAALQQQITKLEAELYRARSQPLGTAWDLFRFHGYRVAAKVLGRSQRLAHFVHNRRSRLDRVAPTSSPAQSFQGTGDGASIPTAAFGAGLPSARDDLDEANR